jgi:dihydropteroate synthase
VSAPLRCGRFTLDAGVRTLVMGIINMSPDSFAGDGLDGDAGAAEARGYEMRADGADLLDVGGRSTRPGAPPVETAEELRRTLPAIRRLVPLGLPVSVDTYSAAVAAAAVEDGAAIVNDLSALRADPGMARVVASAGAGVVLTDWDDRRGSPDVVAETSAFLAERVRAAGAAGIGEAQIIVDPGYGFGVTVAQNLELLRRLAAFKALRRPLLIGTSRKGSIGRILRLPVHERVEGTAATVAVAIMNGADIIRAHDVRAMVRVARMTDAVVRGLPAGPAGRSPA